MKYLILGIFIILELNANCQELKRITKAYKAFGEIYYVLKDNKDVKQGQYLKYYKSIDLHNTIDLYNKTVESFGSYESNKKSGVWIFCNVSHPLNPLISLGEYKNDKKSGQWIYFYGPELKDSSYITSLIKNKKYTKVVLPTKNTEEIQVSLDTTGTKVASTGSYSLGTKIGIWNYYSRSGELVCKFDFSNNRLLYSNRSSISDQLGGIKRLGELLFQSAREQKTDPFFYKDFKVSFEVSTHHDSLSILRINSVGSESFAKLLDEIIHTMSLDWINYDPLLEDNRIRIYINYVIDGNIGKANIDSIVPLIKQIKLNTY